MVAMIIPYICNSGKGKKNRNRKFISDCERLGRLQRRVKELGKDGDETVFYMSAVVVTQL